MTDKLIELAAEFSKIDLSKIVEIERRIASDRLTALEFAVDPDGFMKRNLAGTYMPLGFHFHARVEGELIPAETEQPLNQMTATSLIRLDPTFRDEVIIKLKEGRQAPGDIELAYCEGCVHCMIAIVM